MNRSPRERINRWLLRRGLAADRAAELEAHFADAEERGEPTAWADVGSTAVLAARAVGARAVRDLPWWIAGLPVALIHFAWFATSYEPHFLPWDVVGRTEVVWTSQAVFWSAVITTSLIASSVLGLAWGRRTVEHLRCGRLFFPAATLLTLFLAGTQSDLFIERTPAWRDGRLRAEHVNDIPWYSIGLFLTVSMLPLVALLLDWLLVRRASSSVPVSSELPMSTSDATVRPTKQVRGVAAGDGNRVDLDPMALAATASPVLYLFIGPIAAALVLVATATASRSFSPVLKVAVNAVILIPTAALVVWGVFFLEGANDEIHPAVWVAFGLAFTAVWLMMGIVALRPFFRRPTQIAA